MEYDSQNAILHGIAGVGTAAHQSADEGRFFMSGSWNLNLPPKRDTYSHVDAWDPIVQLWSFQTGAGHRGSSISYSVNGGQHIATPAGWRVTDIGAATQALFQDQDWRNGSK